MSGSAGLVEGDGGGDVGEVGECLGEVAEQGPGRWVEFFGEQSQVVGGRRGLGVGGVGVGGAALAGQAFGQPEGAGDKGALGPFQAVGGAVAQQQPVNLQLAADRVNLDRASTKAVVMMANITATPDLIPVVTSSRIAPGGSGREEPGAS
jgi:hypothetical protein